VGTYTQSKSPIAIGTALGKDKLLLTSFVYDAAVSEPFTLKIRALSEEKNLDIKSLLRTQATVRINLRDDPDAPDVKFLNGKIIRAAVREEHEHLTEYALEMVPWFSFLKLHQDCKIFQEQTTQQIVEKIFNDLGYSDFQFDLQGSGQPREYCVQYRETTFDFVSRLLEEEGYWYFFKHEDGKHTMYISNSNTKFPVCGKKTIRYDVSKSQKWDEEVRDVDFERIARSSVITRRDYNFEDPSLDLTSSISSSNTGGSEEIYDYPGIYLQKSQGDNIADILIDHLDSQVTRASFSSAERELFCGCRVTLANHFYPDANTEMVILSIREEGTFSGYRAAGQGGVEDLDTFTYSNRCTTVPNEGTYRPGRKTPVPVVRGLQTAVVVGPSGEEIYTDKYGRIKVQFFWDRVGKKNENSSCWIRFSTAWAGKNWGMISIPRIGQEVVVDFLEGNPDRPLVVGSVYNAEQMPPYTLPANASQSGLKSRSTKNGGSDNFNEIRFEDKKGSEEFYMQAEKDMNTLVKNDRNTTIRDGNDSLTIKKGNRSTDVQTGGMTTKVKKDYTLEVQGNIKTEAKQTCKHTAGTSHDTEAGTTMKIKAGTMMTIEAGTQIEIKAGSGKIVLNAMGVTITGALIKLN
jgi:type VI secretion system secreted protein VgrG